MLFSWWKRRRRRRLLASPFPREWLAHLERNVVHYRYLSAEEQSRLRDDLRVFVAEKNWEGCGGLRMTDEIRVTVAAHACLLTLGLSPDLFERVQSVLVYPSGYRAPESVDRLGLVDQDGEARLGEAHYRGPVVLSWDEVRHDGRHPERGQNLVFHEFAHQLDMLSGAVDGTPPLESEDLSRRWREVMGEEFRRLATASPWEATLLDSYGATNPAEFFAVATECFFDRPADMERYHRRLYDLLREFYRQDPAARCRARLPAQEGPR
jgi:MtfA peptidase